MRGYSLELERHACEVLPLGGGPGVESACWYLTCHCGYCGPVRRDRGLAVADLEAHVRAARENES